MVLPPLDRDGIIRNKTRLRDLRRDFAREVFFIRNLFNQIEARTKERRWRSWFPSDAAEELNTEIERRFEQLSELKKEALALVVEAHRPAARPELRLVKKIPAPHPFQTGKHPKK